MKYLNTFLITIALFCSFVSIGQENIVGSVTDIDGNALPAVNVVIEGTTDGVSTDFDGKYSLQAQIGQSLVFSYLGFETQIIKILKFKLGKSSLNIDPRIFFISILILIIILNLIVLNRVNNINLKH